MNSADSARAGRHARTDAPTLRLPTTAAEMNPVSRKLILARYASQTLWALVLAACFIVPQLLYGGWWWTGAAAVGAWYVFQLLSLIHI